MTFIKNAIKSFTHPDHLRVEAAYSGEFNWNSGLSISQMQTNIDSAQKTSMSYSLSKQAANLLTSIEALNNVKDPISAIIFISDTSDAALQNADRWFSKLQNVQITFVLLGTNVNSMKLRNFTKNFIYWSDFSNLQPDNWDLLSCHAFGCNTPPSSPSMTCSTLMPFIPCLSYIHFGIDDSNVLDEISYKTQLNFISSAIGNISHPERVEVMSGYNETAYWYSGLTTDQIQSELLTLPQEGPYALRRQFAGIQVATMMTELINIPIAALIFISDTSDKALTFADSSNLKNVELTFVLLGPNVDASKLTKFSSNFIYWSDLSKPQPDNWDSEFSKAYGCH
jgi:hypothetical protein